MNDNAPNVISLHGGPVVVGQRAPNAYAIEAIQRLLEMAVAGELVGFACAYLRCDGAADYERAGVCGGYSLLGALNIMNHELVEIEFSKDEA